MEEVIWVIIARNSFRMLSTPEMPPFRSVTKQEGWFDWREYDSDATSQLQNSRCSFSRVLQLYRFHPNFKKQNMPVGGLVVVVNAYDGGLSSIKGKQR